MSISTGNESEADDRQSALPFDLDGEVEEDELSFYSLRGEEAHMQTILSRNKLKAYSQDLTKKASILMAKNESMEARNIQTTGGLQPLWNPRTLDQESPEHITYPILVSRKKKYTLENLIAKSGANDVVGERAQQKRHSAANVRSEQKLRPGINNDVQKRK